jgi:hypothetical protein
MHNQKGPNKYIMDKQKFNKPNRLAEEALEELRQRLVEISLTDAEFEIENRENIIKIFKINGEPNWNEKYIIVTKKKEILLKILTGEKDLFSLTKNEWNEILNPSPSNSLIFRYFKKLHNAFKTNAKSNGDYESAYFEINRILKEKWGSNSKNFGR